MFWLLVYVNLLVALCFKKCCLLFSECEFHVFSCDSQDRHVNAIALAFFEDRGVFFLSPEKSKPLTKLHSLHDANAGFSSMNKFYRTAKWDPHCSLASRLTPKQVHRCASLFDDFKLPFKATCISSHLVKYPDPVILSSFEYETQ